MRPDLKPHQVVDLAVPTIVAAGWSAQLVRAYVFGVKKGRALLLKELGRIAAVHSSSTATDGDTSTVISAVTGVSWDANKCSCLVDRSTDFSGGDCGDGNHGGDDGASSILVMNSNNDGGGGGDGDGDGDDDGRPARSTVCLSFSDFHFHNPPKKLVPWVLGSYLPRKVGNFLGLPTSAVADDTPVMVPSSYVGDEGKIKGMWERFNNNRDKILDLRVDLQPPLREATTHCGDAGWAMWAVQYGPSNVCAVSSKKKREFESGGFAAVLMQTDTAFSFADLRAALATSFMTMQIACLAQDDGGGCGAVRPGAVAPAEEKGDRGGGGGDVASSGEKGSAPTTWRVFCDLDGVLADFDAGLVEATGKRPCDFTSVSRMWQSILSLKKHFFETLPWTPDGSDLWTFLCGEGCAEVTGRAAPVVLTGVPPAKNGGKVAAKHKRLWCSAKLGADVEVLTCDSRDKSDWSGAGCILVDDLLDHKKGWEGRGGVFIHHVNASSTIRQLRLLMFPNGGLTGEESKAAQTMRADGLRVAEELGQGSVFQLSVETIVLVDGHSGECELAAAVEAASLLSPSSLTLGEKEGGGDGKRNAHNAGVAALDVEWRPDELLKGRAGSKCSAASLLQIAMGGLCRERQVFLVDIATASPRTQQAIVALLGDPTIIKIGFGLQEDLARLAAGIDAIRQFVPAAESVVDLQSNMLQSLIRPYNEDSGGGGGDGGGGGNSELSSLSGTAHLICGLTMNKSKELQASEWNHRPLSPAQMQYAACDAAILIHMWEALMDHGALRDAVLASMVERRIIPRRAELRRYVAVPNTGIQELGGSTTMTSAADGDHSIDGDMVGFGMGGRRDVPPLADPAPVLAIAPMGRVKMLTSAVFLTAESRNRLLETFPAEQRNIMGDHVTVRYAPSGRDMVGVTVGKRCLVRVVRHASDARSQAVRVNVVDWDTGEKVEVGMGEEITAPHITISTAINTAAVRSNQLFLSPADRLVRRLPKLCTTNKATNERESKGGCAATVGSGANDGADVLKDGITETGLDEEDAPSLLELEGILGVKVSLEFGQSTLVDLDKRLLTRLIDFVTDAEGGARLKFKPGELGGAERAAVHEFAKARGLESRSEGPPHKRRLMLSVPKFYTEAVGVGGEGGDGGGDGGRVVSCAADLDKYDDAMTRRGRGGGRPSKSSKKDDKSRRVGSTSRIVLEQAVFGMLDLGPVVTDASNGYGGSVGGHGGSSLSGETRESGIAGRMVHIDSNEHQKDVEEDVKDMDDTNDDVAYSADDGAVQRAPLIVWDPLRATPSPDSPEALLRALVGGDDGDEEETCVPGRKKTIIILRGLPGSGKSMLAKNLAATTAWSDGSDGEEGGEVQDGHPHSIICSADAYFESGAGQRRRQRKGRGGGDGDDLDVYHENYDGAKIGDAHDYCRAQFAGALADDSVRGIIVDNTNTRLSEYAWYIKEADKFGQALQRCDCHSSVAHCGGDGGGASCVRVIVAELFCESRDMMRALHARNRHRVPLQAVGRLYARMEIDPRAVLIAPASGGRGGGGSGEGDGDRGTRGGDESGDAASQRRREGKLSDWLAAHHCFHNVPSRPRTCMQLQHVFKVDGDVGSGGGGGRVSTSMNKFVHVPPSVYDEFLERYADETTVTLPSTTIDGRGRGGQRGGDGATRWWLAEYATEPCFRLFLDFDLITENGQHVKSEVDEIEVARLLQQAVVDCGEFPEFVGLGGPGGLGERKGASGSGGKGDDDGKETATRGLAGPFPRVVVVGRPGVDLLADGRTKQCFHMHCRDVIVDQGSVRRIRQRLILSLTDRWPGVDWGVVVDDEVYTHMTLRMMGSAKPESAVDASVSGGRLYDLLGVLSATGEDDFESSARYNRDRVQLLRDTSIRCLPEEMRSYAKDAQGKGHAI
jgi:hypothetical protein